MQVIDSFEAACIYGGKSSLISDLAYKLGFLVGVGVKIYEFCRQYFSKAQKLPSTVNM